ncbi:MAG: hypothetical protein M1499_06380 [Firmicutes bacterium]|jgi:archaellum component FlaC|nr:hypothetical protein [Bacillota bacterium]
MDPVLEAYLEGMFQNLTQQIAQSREHAERLNQETRVLMEDVRHEVQLVAEGVTTVRDQLGRILTDHEERITRLERRIP